jgi:hypothetical protein
MPFIDGGHGLPRELVPCIRSERRVERTLLIVPETM